jgi:hypothetical protein
VVGLGQAEGLDAAMEHGAARTSKNIRRNLTSLRVADNMSLEFGHRSAYAVIRVCPAIVLS